MPALPAGLRVAVHGPGALPQWRAVRAAAVPGAAAAQRRGAVCGRDRGHTGVPEVRIFSCHHARLVQCSAVQRSSSRANICSSIVAGDQTMVAAQSGTCSSREADATNAADAATAQECAQQQHHYGQQCTTDSCALLLCMLLLNVHHVA